MSGYYFRQLHGRSTLLRPSTVRLRFELPSLLGCASFAVAHACLWVALLAQQTSQRAFGQLLLCCSRINGLAEKISMEMVWLSIMAVIALNCGLCCGLQLDRGSISAGVDRQRCSH